MIRARLTVCEQSATVQHPATGDMTRRRWQMLSLNACAMIH